MIYIPTGSELLDPQKILTKLDLREGMFVAEKGRYSQIFTAQHEAEPIPQPRVPYLGWGDGEFRLSQEWDDRSYRFLSIRK